MKTKEYIAEKDASIKKINAEISELRDKAATTQAELQDRVARLQEKMQERNEVLRKLIADRNRAEADRKAQQFMFTAKAMDTDGDSNDKFAAFERLAAELSFAGRLNCNRYEARDMIYRRMRREGDAKVFKPPFYTWEALASAWLRPAGTENVAA